ncbi:hypothetical protein DFJ74DRAFT_662764 [Hyaloraphidium curvatum]|nr:hypothetical protein DFJ74DRAFT_662764 [Hyaloraphidium curvatum]
MGPMETKAVTITVPDASSDVDERNFIVTPAEYLAAVPAFPAVGPSFSGAPAPPDRAEQLRVARPLDKQELLAGLAAQPALRWFTALQLWLTPAAARALERGVLFWLVGTALLSACWAFRGDLFATKQFAVGFVTLVLFFAQGAIVAPSFTIYRRPLGAWVRSGPRNLDPFPLAGLVRWTQVVAAEGTKTTDHSLLDHAPRDSLCPCSLSECAGGLVRGIAVLRILEAAFRTAFVLTFSLFTFWTPFVTFAGAVWTTPWAAVLAAFTVVAMACHNIPNTICRFTGNVAIFRLSERVAYRAMKLALADLLGRLRSGVSHLSSPVSDEPYAELHAVFTAVWKTRVSNLNFSAVTLLTLGIAALGALVNMIVGSCIPAVYIIFFCYTLLTTALFDLLSLAASNAQVISIRDLYLEAQREIRELPVIPNSELAADIRRHDAVLSSYAEVARFRGRFMGFAVDYGVVRTVLVTVVTLVVGLWSIFRGLGIAISIDFACHSGL